MLSLGALLGEARGTSSNEFDLHWQRIAARNSLPLFRPFPHRSVRHIRARREAARRVASRPILAAGSENPSWSSLRRDGKPPLALASVIYDAARTLGVYRFRKPAPGLNGNPGAIAA
jgi:hypothetical protein